MNVWYLLVKREGRKDYFNAYIVRSQGRFTQQRFDKKGNKRLWYLSF